MMFRFGLVRLASAAVLVGGVAVAAGAALQFQIVDGPDLPASRSPELYIHEWVAIGPFWSEPGCKTRQIWQKKIIEVDRIRSLAVPLRRADGKQVRWNRLQASESEVVVDLGRFERRGEFGVVFVATYVYADHAGKRTLLVGSDDGVVVWLNGRKVHENYVDRGCTPDQDVVAVELRKGRNLLILKVTQGQGLWGFACRFKDNAGIAVGVEEDAQRARPLTTEEALKRRPAVVVAGPYVQGVSREGATILWQTNVPSLARLTVFHKGGAESAQTSRPRRLSEVRIRGMRPDTSYPYLVRVWNEASADVVSSPKGGWIRTLPARRRRVKILAYGDSRSHPDRHAYVISRMMAEPDVDCVLHSGDIVANGAALEEWIPQFFVPAQGLISRTCMFFVLGNHENNSRYYFMYFALPGGERWYSFDVGPVHCIALDSNMPFGPGSVQYEWLVADLRASRSQPWKIVFCHHPTYTSSGHGRLREDGRPRERGIRTAQEVFPALAREYGIDLVLAGHDHVYERSVRDGVQYVITGGGGAPAYGKAPEAERQNPYSVVFRAVLHYCVITADAGRLELVAKTPAGEVIDRVELFAGASRRAVTGGGPG